jgi:hypothetical protein
VLSRRLAYRCAARVAGWWRAKAARRGTAAPAESPAWAVARAGAAWAVAWRARAGAAAAAAAAAQRRPSPGARRTPPGAGTAARARCPTAARSRAPTCAAPAWRRTAARAPRPAPCWASPVVVGGGGACESVREGERKSRGLEPPPRSMRYPLSFTRWEPHGGRGLSDQDLKQPTHRWGWRGRHARTHGSNTIPRGTAIDAGESRFT